MLPFELERDIFEYAARSHSYSITSIVLVARRCQIWIEPMLYNSVVLYRKRWTTPRFMQTLNTRPAEFFAKTVKYIHILPAYFHDEDDIYRILTLCTGITQLIDHSCTPLPFPILSRLNLKGLCIAVDMITNRPIDGFFCRSVFKDVTHLLVYADPSQWTSLEFSQLPALTHLALEYHHSRDVSQEGIFNLHGILEHCPLLQALVVYVQNDPWCSNADQNTGNDDPRLVILPKADCLSSMMFMESWNLVNSIVAEQHKKWNKDTHIQRAVP